MLGIRGVCRRALPLSSSDWITLASGSALWALALYIPLSGPLGRLEAELSGTGLSESLQTTILVLSSLLTAERGPGALQLAKWPWKQAGRPKRSSSCTSLGWLGRLSGAPEYFESKA